MNFIYFFIFLYNFNILPICFFFIFIMILSYSFNVLLILYIFFLYFIVVFFAYITLLLCIYYIFMMLKQKILCKITCSIIMHYYITIIPIIIAIASAKFIR